MNIKLSLLVVKNKHTILTLYSNGFLHSTGLYVAQIDGDKHTIFVFQNTHVSVY